MIEVFDKELLFKIRYLIDKNKPMQYISNALDIDESIIEQYVQQLRLRDARYDLLNGEPVKNHKPVTKYQSEIIRPERICFLSDIHYTLDDEVHKVVEEVYELCDKKNINTILCSGDFTNGFVSRKHTNSLMNYIVENHPKSNDINFYTITGNHDNCIEKHIGYNFLNELSCKRDDIIYLGKNEGAIDFNGVDIYLNHGNCTKETNLSKRAKIAFEKCPYEGIDIVSLGHIHKSGVLFDKESNTYVVQNSSLICCSKSQTVQENQNPSYYISNIYYDNDGNFETMNVEKAHVKKRILIKKNTKCSK